MNLNWMLYASPTTAFSVVLLFGSAAQAEGEPCFRDTECAGAELCLDGACGVDPAAPTCTTADDCRATPAECVSGVCKTDGVVCRNPAGTCWRRDMSGSCECTDGSGSGWSDGFNPDDPPKDRSDETLLMECTMFLEGDCGTEAPSLPPSCAGDVGVECEVFVNRLDAVQTSCGVMLPEANLARIAQCCDEYAERTEDRACLMAVQPGDCGGIEACDNAGVGGTDTDGVGESGESGANDGTDGGDPSADDQSGGDKGSCAVGGRSQAAWWALLLLSLGWRRRYCNRRSLA